MTESIQSPTAVLEMARTFEAPVERLYRAFTDAESLAQWGCGTSYDNLALDIDPRPGGVYHHRVKSRRDGTEWTFFGVYHQVEPDRKLSYSFEWETDWREPSGPSMVELSFHSKGEGSELEMRHSQMPEAARESTEKHWTEFIDVLGQLLAQGQL